MPEKDPTAWQLSTWILVLTMSLLGGISIWYRRIKTGHTRAFNIIELIGEIATSGMMGFTGFAVGMHYLDSESLAAVLAGMSAHFSTRILFQAEGLLDKLAKKISDDLDKK